MAAAEGVFGARTMGKKNLSAHSSATGLTRPTKTTIFHSRTEASDDGDFSLTTMIESSRDQAPKYTGRCS